MKTSIRGIEFKDYAEARLWKDDETGALTLSVDDPFDGFKPDEIRRLAKFLNKVVERLDARKKRKSK